ncbi:MAG: caspase family protein [Pseudomonadota bacterium]
MVSTFVAICVYALATGSVVAEERIALVVGNGAYQRVTNLDNPVSDARLMARALRRAGFDVTLVTDGAQRRMQDAIVEFGRRLRQAGPGTTALFYFAGHGVQAAGRNFLIPTDADIRDQADLDVTAVPVGWIMGQMESAGTTNIVILDACRNNPFARSYRSASAGGLARENAPTGSFIAFATAPGQVAADGIGDNSPYTAALARAIALPGLAIEQMFKQVRVDVLAETGGAQVPWESSSLVGDFYFTPGTEAPMAQPAETPAPSPSAPSPSAPRPDVAAVTPQRDEPVRRSDLGALSLRLDVEFRQDARPCRDARRIARVALPLTAGTAPVEATATAGRPSLDFTLRAQPSGQGVEVTVTPRDGNSAGAAVTVALDSANPGAEATVFSNARHPAVARCGGMILHARVVE